MADIRGAGDAPGGMGQFLMGLIMAVAGGCLPASRVTATGGFRAVKANG